MTGGSTRTMRAMIVCWITAILALAMVEEAQAFVKGSPHVNARPVFVSSQTELRAVAKKKAATKKAAKKKAASKTAATKADVETMRKAEIVTSVAEKMECTKIEAENALAAVLGTITEVGMEVDMI